jgi:ABC-type multidrug transport system fused ATPase/permease subunit
MQQPTVIASYEQSVKEYTSQYEVINNKYGRLSMGRLFAALMAIAAFYAYYQNSNQELLAAVGFFAVVLFIVMMKLHQQAGVKRTFIKTLKTINEDELSFLNGNSLPFASGEEYKSEHHAYANDLDLFGHRSLYQYLNRTATQMGKDKLALSLQQLQDDNTIKQNQQAIAELSADRKARHDFYALGKIAGDNKDIYHKLISWTEQQEPPVPKVLLAVAFLLPTLLAAVIVAYAITRDDLYWNILTKLFLANLFVFFFWVKKIRKAMFSADKVNEMLKEYAAMLQMLEQTNFKSEKLLILQQKLKSTGAQASIEIKKLASIFAGMETVQNPFSAVIMNGLYLHHIHQLNKLNNWKKKYAVHVREWLEVIGEMEMLNSLANLHESNPGFTFPTLNNNYQISFENLGHPLIAEQKRVCNDVTFTDQRFIILTGSNMSGKSTFLRTLGINMVLAGMGSAICASAANIHPLKIFVSMRQTDSLADHESYFFAEVKRLKFIMEQLGNEVCFVLLDEILRGTNSDDKRSGTIGVIEKMIGKDAIGAIATHDLEVCLTTNQHPDRLVNKCFEVEIISNELAFDYKLRNGICKNKSATFLMKKMEII